MTQHDDNYNENNHQRSRHSRRSNGSHERSQHKANHYDNRGYNNKYYQEDHGEAYPDNYNQGHRQSGAYYQEEMSYPPEVYQHQYGYDKPYDVPI